MSNRNLQIRKYKMIGIGEEQTEESQQIQQDEDEQQLDGQVVEILDSSMDKQKSKIIKGHSSKYGAIFNFVNFIFTLVLLEYVIYIYISWGFQHSTNKSSHSPRGLICI